MWRVVQSDDQESETEHVRSWRYIAVHDQVRRCVVDVELDISRQSSVVVQDFGKGYGRHGSWLR